MDFNSYKQGPPKYPLLAEVTTEYLVRPNGKPTLLAYLLKDLGCTIHAASLEHGTTPVVHDEATLVPVVERIIKDYIQYHNHHVKGHDDSPISMAMRDDVSHFMDPSDFVPGTLSLKPISIDDIERFMTDIVRIRTDKGEKLKNGNPELQARINALCTKLADMITEIQLAASSEKCKNIADAIREEVHDVTGFAKFSKQMILLKQGVYKKSWSKIDTKKPIQDEKVLHAFTTLRALTRLKNHEAGIDTGKELDQLTQKREQEDMAYKGRKFTPWNGVPKEKAA